MSAMWTEGAIKASTARHGTGDESRERAVDLIVRIMRPSSARGDTPTEADKKLAKILFEACD